MSILDPNNPLSPFYRIKIRNKEQARIHRNLMIIKIILLLVILIALLALSGFAWQALVFAIIFAAGWKALEYMLKERRNSAATEEKDDDRYGLQQEF